MRKALGVLMMAAPFVVMFFMAERDIGLLYTLAIFAAFGVLTIWVVVAVYLITVPQQVDR